MATVRFRLNHPEKPGERSILVELYINSSIKPEISTGEKLLAKHWAGSRANSKAPDYHKLNDNLGRIEKELIQLWRDNLSDLSKIKALMPGVVRGTSSTSEKKRIFEALEKFLIQYKDEKEEKTIGKYSTMQSRLVEFDKLHPIDFETLDYNFYDQFKRFLYEQPNPNYPGCSLHLSDSKDFYLIGDNSRGIRIGLFDDTVYKYFVNLKTFLRWSEKRGYQAHPSFKTWEIIKRRPEPISLTLEELEHLETFNFFNLDLIIEKFNLKETLKRLKVKPGNFEKLLYQKAKQIAQALDYARDYFVFECRTGQRISDIKRFDKKDLSDMKWTHYVKKGNRLSSKTVTVHFKGYSHPAYLILTKHNFVLPVLSEQTINDNIKRACDIAGINQVIHTDRWAANKKIRIIGPKYDFISTHNGRATFITLALSHGMPVEYVMELTGITEYSTLSHYRAKFEDSSVEKYLESVSENIAIMKKAQ